MGQQDPLHEVVSKPHTPAAASDLGNLSATDLRRLARDLQQKNSDLETENRILREALLIEDPIDANIPIDFAFMGSVEGDERRPAQPPLSRDLSPEPQPSDLSAPSPKALTCLYEIDRLASSPGSSLEQILQDIVSYLPRIWIHPHLAAAHIEVGPRTFGIKNPIDATEHLRSDLFISDRKAGEIAIFLQPSAERADEDHFSANERHLLKAVAEKISTILDRHYQMGLRRRVEARFRKVFDTSPDAIVISRLKDGRLIDVNEGFCAMTGYCREDVIGKSSVDLDIWIIPENRQDLIRPLLRHGQIRNIEGRFRRKNGSEAATLVSAATLHLDGEPHILSMVRDITDLKRAEAERRRQKETVERQNRILKETQSELVASREQFSDLYHSAPVGYFSFSPEGRVLALNQTGSELLGLASDAILSEKFSAFVVPADQATFAGHLDTVFRTGKRHICAIQLVRRDSNDFFARLESIALTDEQTGAWVCRTTVSDNTDIKKADMALKASYRFLHIANSHSHLDPALNAFVREIKAITGCSAAGIRMLDADGNIPYAVIEGFCEGFYEAENGLSVHRDVCLCIRVIEGDVDPELPFFTASGSFYTNSTSRLLASPEAQLLGKRRNTCNRLGYETVGLIPVKAENRTLGLIHVADPRSDQLSPETVALLETAALQLGTSVQRVNAVEALKKNKEQLEERVYERTAELVLSNEMLKQEIQGRERMAAQLRESKNMLQAVFDGISDPLILTDQEMTVLTINEAAKRYFRLENPDSAIGKICRSLFQPPPEQCGNCQISSAIAEGKNITFERDGLMDPDRQEQVVVYPICKPDETPGHAVIRINDITESRIVERQLIQNEKMASLGMLVSSIAHELNNPNSFIAFNVPILREYFKEVLPIIDHFAAEQPDFEVANMPYDMFREDAFRLLDNLEHGSMRISAFLGNLREFARSKPVTEKKWADLRQIVERSLAICRTKIQKTVKRLIVSLPKEESTLYTNPVALEQILINLLVNAAQAADKADSFIRLSVEKPESQSEGWRFEIEDNGCGMDEKTRLQIFEPFFSTKLNEGGSGLGLYICKRLVRDLGGSIQVKSQNGQGSTFSLELECR